MTYSLFYLHVFTSEYDLDTYNLVSKCFNFSYSFIFKHTSKSSPSYPHSPSQTTPPSDSAPH